MGGEVCACAVSGGRGGACSADHWCQAVWWLRQAWPHPPGTAEESQLCLLFHFDSPF